MAQDGKHSMFVFYTPLHEALAFDAHARGQSIVATTLWCERLLEKHNVPYISARAFVPQGTELDTLLEQVEMLAREWYRIPQMQFFAYKGIRLGEALEPMADFYVQRFFYHFVLFNRLFAAHSDIASVTVPYVEAENNETAGPLAPFEGKVVVDAARAASLGLAEFRAVGQEPALPKNVFPPNPKGAAFLDVLNGFMRLLPKKRERIFASEYWSHIAPIFEHVRNTELVCMDRSEVRKIPLKKIVTHRMRFIHPLGVNARIIRAHAAKVEGGFAASWQQAKEAVQSLPQFMCEGKNVGEALEPAFSYLVTEYAKRVIADIDGIEHILLKEKITKVLLRASIGGRQHHFFLAAAIARRLGIPSIELQHANEIIDPRTIHARLETSYLFGYGVGTRDIVVSTNKIEPERIIPAGSPRFDAYITRKVTDSERALTLTRMGLDPTKPVVFVGMPNELPDLYFIDFDSYAVDTCMRELQNVRSMLPEAQFIFKFRPGNLTDAYRTYMQEVFGEKGIYLANREDLYSLLLLADAALVGNSTLLYEAMIASVPVLLYPLRPHDTYFKNRFAPVVPVPSAAELPEVLKKVLEDKTYRDGLVTANTHYLQEKYCFDGKSSERIAALLSKPLASI